MTFTRVIEGAVVADEYRPDDDARRERAADRGRASAEEATLAASLSALAELSTVPLDLTKMLTQVAKLAVWAIPGADGAGLTLLELDRADLIVKSEPFVRAIDNIQYGIGEGPCISAAATGRTKRSGQLEQDLRWPQFGPRAAKLGVHSALSLPLRTPTKILGAMNVYAHPSNAFSARAQELGETFAVSAALAVQHAQVFEQTIRLANELHAGLNNRALIDQAIGVLRFRDGRTSEDALERLQQMSTEQRRSVTDIALAVVRETGRHGPDREIE
ncbi:GAF and ANTAR domain-containing protein [Nakamurella sp. GG22]